MIERITSHQNPRIKQAIRLHSSRGRQTQGRIIVFGTREVVRASAAGVKFDELFVSGSEPAEFVNRLQADLEAPDTRVVQVDEAVFSKLAFGDRTDGVVGTAQRPNTELETLSVDPDDAVAPSLVVVLQAIEKPGNLGAIYRTADACGAAAVMCADPLTDVFHPNAIRSSTGTVFQVPTACASSSQVQQWLTDHHYHVVTAMPQNATDYFQADLSGRLAIVLGNEANGLDRQWQREGYTPAMLPMHGIADSLNVSVTASVMLYEAMRQRSRPNRS